MFIDTATLIESQGEIDIATLIESQGEMVNRIGKKIRLGEIEKL